MCTLVLAWGVFADAPLVVAANRDERTDRAADPPAVVGGEPRVVAPRDREAGGTWIGYNEEGVLAAITNRWTDADLAGERSRGLLVRDALEHEHAEAAARAVERDLVSREYAGFNLLLADAAAAILFEWDGRLRPHTLGPGVHVVMNVGYDDRFDVPDSRAEAGERQIESARAVGARLQPEPGEIADDWLDRAGTVLGDHDCGICVHGDGFGTRSSSLIALREGEMTYHFADGPPCRTDYERVEAEI